MLAVLNNKVISTHYGLSPRLTMICLLGVSVFLDIAYGILSYVGLGSLPVSLLYRVGILAAFMVVLLRYNDFETWFIKAVIAIWLLCLCFWLVSYGGVPIVHEINHFLRSIFTMCIALLCYNALWLGYKAKQDISGMIANGIVFYGAIAAVMIVFSFITGIGNLTYGPWAFGYKSFFTGGNDIGLAMLISLVMAWTRLWNKDSLINVAIIVLITAGISLIGSRAAWGGVIGITVMFSLAYLMVKKANSGFTYTVKVLIFIVVIGGGSFAGKLVYDNLDALAHSIQRITELLDGVSPRAHLEKAGHQVLENRHEVYDILGQGTEFYYEVKERFGYNNRSITNDGRAKQLPYKLIEQDPFDLYGVYGLILGGMLIGYHFFYWLWSCRLFLTRRNIEFFAISMALSIYVFHGTFAGHAFITPQVGTVAGCLMGLIRYRVKVAEYEKQQGFTP